MRRGNQNIMGILLRTSALATVAAVTAAPALAQDYGVVADGPDDQIVDNPAGSTIQGDKIGVFARQGAVIVTNSGTIRGNGSYDGFDFAPEGGITIARAGSSVTNGGTISGAGFGITTAYFFNPVTGELEPNAIGTSVTNLAGSQIIGDSNDGVRLIGGGTLTNAGAIEGRVGTFADGVSMFAYNGQDTTGQTGIGTVTNQAGGTIIGNRLGVILSGGGTINNAGTILGPNFSGGTLDGFGGGVLIQGQDGATGKIGTITNSGTITGGSGARFGGNLASGSVDNSGTITGTQFAGIDNSSLGVVTINNQAGGTISGARMGVLAREGAVNVTNAGTITGNGGGGNGAIVIEAGGSSVSNSGLIQGNSFGITANSYFNTTTGQSEGRAVNTLVTNSGTIRGLNNDGVRLIGGGTVTNSGMIEGLASGGADGISIFTHAGQDTSGFASLGTVNNSAGGTIFGNRFGIILSVGGEVNNAGSINGNVGGIVIQDGLGDGGKTGKVANSGTISGGSGVSFGVELVSSSLTNSGSITGTVNDGVVNSGTNALTIDNLAGGTITGALKGVHAAEGAVIVTNAGMIRGNGTYDGFEATPDGGISIGVGGSSITNSGTISGARFGITTYNYYNATTGLTEPRAIGTTVVNLAGGSIIGEGDDGVRLIGGGTVTNAGLIEGRNFLRAEGVSMFALNGQDTSGQTGLGTVDNLAGGTIFGNRFGIGLSGGGVVNNAGTILASDFSTGSIDGFGAGILFQTATGELGRIGTLNNSGSISGGHGIIYGGSLASSSITNSGSITGTRSAGVINSGTGIVSIDNQAGGSISGAQSGVIARTGAVTITNAGTITGNGGGNNGGVLIERNGTSISNSGLIQGTRFGIVANPSGAQPWTTGTIVNNSGTIRGLNNDGMRLVGGGTVTNSGLIEGVADPFNLATDGVSMFSFTGQDVSGITSIGTVNNLAGGTINGLRSGIIMSTGGTVNNAGSIWAPDLSSVSGNGLATGIVIQDGTNSGGKIGTIDNSGSIGAGVGIIYGFGLASGSLTNSGTITGRVGDGVTNDSGALVTIDNQATGTITGATYGILGRSGAITVANAGAITGNGGGHAGIQIEQAGSSVSNSGTITGTNFGITTASYTNSAGVSEGRAIGTVVSNTGTIRGQNNDGVRLIGGGTVTNSGLIEGLNSIGSDGVSMLTHSGQDTSTFASLGTVNNQAGGSIFGDRLGVILSTGGEVNNAGSISGNVGGVTIQDGVNNGGKTGTIANTGTISGGTSSAVTFGVHLVSNSLENSGTIRGGTSGVITEAGALSLVNTGSIRGDGTSISANIPDSGSGTDISRADGGVVIAAANSTIDNSGNISGRVHGIVVVPQINTQTGVYEGVARNTSITNSGLIRGETDDGIRLAGGGSVVNSGTIEGVSGTNTDGITMFAFTGQDTSAMPTIGSVTNTASGIISGARIGVLMSKGGVLDNAGSISGRDGIFIQNSTNLAALTASVTNSGSITAVTRGVVFGTTLVNTTASLLNSGTISVAGSDSTDAGIRHFSAGRLTVTNTASGLITSQDYGIYTGPGALTVNNAGQITATGIGYHAGIRTDGVGLRVINSGLISGRDGIAAIGQAGDTQVTNSGTIRGIGDTGLWLSGGGTVTNTGLIEGTQYGVWLEYNGRPFGSDGLGTIINSAAGTINGGTNAIRASEYIRLENAGTINGNVVTNGGVITNSGTINGNVLNFNSSNYIDNLGTINGDLTLGFNTFANIDNRGTMGNIFSSASTNMNNWGTVGTIVFGGYNDLLTLRAGSRVLGEASGGDGSDQLRLDSGTAPVQTLGRFFNFELLNLISGQWEAPGSTGTFGNINLTGGKLTLTGSLSGAMSISGPGTFQIGAGGSVGGFTGSIANNGSMIVNIGSDYSLASAMSGTGSFLKSGPAMLTLSGTSTHTGPTTVSGGTLAVTGRIASPTTVQSGAVLAGTGTVGSVTLQAGGTISPGAGTTPGNGIGTLNVVGQLSFGADSRFRVNANAAGQADRINVSGGSVVIQPNSIVNVLAADGTYKTSTAYVIIDISGGKLLGRFAGVTSDLIFLEPKLGHNIRSVELILKRNSVSLTTAAATTSQASVAAALETMGETGLLQEAVLSQNLLGARAAFDSLSGDFFGTISNRIAGSAQRLQSNLATDASATPQGPAMWTMVESGARAGFAPEYRSGMSLARNGFRASLMSGYIPFERMAAGNEGSASMATHYVGGSFGYADNGWNLQAGAGFARHEVRASRSIAFSGFADGSQTRYSASTRQLFGEVSYSFQAGGLSLTPYAKASSVAMSGMQIEEIGGDAALSITSIERKLNLASTGFRAAGSFDLGKGLRLVPRVALGWQWAGGDLGTWQQSRFKSHGSRFDIIAAPVKSSGIDVDAGLELAFGRMSLSAEYRRNEVLRNVGDGAHLTFRTAF